MERECGMNEIDLTAIKLFVMDVDGTLTDGKLYIGNNGEIFKAFDVKDGCGIRDILPEIGVEPVIITARNSDIVSNRCKELDISMCFQGIRNKKTKLIELCDEKGFVPEVGGVYKEVAYIGDDILDLPIMNIARLRACPANASEKVKGTANWISQYDGGYGAVRELVDYLADAILDVAD